MSTENTAPRSDRRPVAATLAGSVVRRAAVTFFAVLAFALVAGQALADPNPSASCVATLTSIEAQSAPRLVGSEASSLAPLGELASQLAQLHLGDLEACSAAEG